MTFRGKVTQRQVAGATRNRRFCLPANGSVGARCSRPGGSSNTAAPRPSNARPIMSACRTINHTPSAKNRGLVDAEKRKCGGLARAPRRPPSGEIRARVEADPRIATLVPAGTTDGGLVPTPRATMQDSLRCEQRCGSATAARSSRSGAKRMSSRGVPRAIASSRDAVCHAMMCHSGPGLGSGDACDVDASAVMARSSPLAALLPSDGNLSVFRAPLRARSAHVVFLRPIGSRLNDG